MRPNCSHKEKLLSTEFVSGWQADQLMDKIKVRLPKQLSLFVLLSKNMFLLIAIIRKFCPPRLTRLGESFFTTMLSSKRLAACETETENAKNTPTVWNLF